VLFEGSQKSRATAVSFPQCLQQHWDENKIDVHAEISAFEVRCVIMIVIILVWALRRAVEFIGFAAALSFSGILI
jgi:hypothetical protein